MATRTIVGNLAGAPEHVQAGKVGITKFRVIENTYSYRDGERVEDPDPTTHFVEAKFELGENALESLGKGDQVIVVGNERSTSWEKDGAKQYGRVIDATHVGASLARATVTITRNPRNDS